MGKFLRLSAGVQRSFDESGTPAIYDRHLQLVTSSPGTDEIVGPITTGTAITLPGGQTYTSDELEVWLNSTRQEAVFDYTYVGSPARTQISFNFDLVVGDRIRFRIDRGA